MPEMRASCCSISSTNARGRNPIRPGNYLTEGGWTFTGIDFPTPVSQSINSRSKIQILQSVGLAGERTMLLSTEKANKTAL